MSTVLRHGMTSDEFYGACDDLMESYQLRVGTPTLDMNVVSIAVQEGSHLLCYLNDGKLVDVGRLREMLAEHHPEPLHDDDLVAPRERSHLARRPS